MPIKDCTRDLAVAVIVPTLNRREVTIRFVREINSQKIPLRIYVSDSDSSDGTVQAVANEPNVRVVLAGSTAWWSAAVNRGIEQARRDGANIFLVMNDDILFSTDLISRLLAAHRKFPGCVICPLQRTDSGDFIGTLYEGIFRRVRHIARAPKDGLVATSNGCCLLIPAAAFDLAGYFDEENCPHLYGDTEFQLRAMKMGFPTRPCGDAEIQQMQSTNYFGRLRLTSLFVFEGSPLHLRAYVTFGKTLFGSHFRFALLGIRFHFDFLKVLIKTLRFILNKKVSTLKARYAKL